MSSAANKSTFDPAQVTAALKPHYGDFTIAKELPSERDQNFLATLEGEGREFSQAVIKIHNREDARDVIRLQEDMMTHVLKNETAKKAGILFQRTLAASNGELCVTMEGHLVRVLEFMPGKMLGDVEQPPGVIENVGKAAACVCNALKGFTTDVPKEFTHRDESFAWDLQHALPHIKAYRKYISTDARKEILDKAIAPFEKEEWKSVLKGLPRQIAHNDMNDQNVAVGDGSIAILDWGDAAYTYVIADPAICVPYLMFGKSDPFEDAFIPFLKGFTSEFSLNADELKCVFPLAILRMSTSVVMSAYGATVRPDDPYITISEKGMWDMLEKVGGMDWDQVATRIAAEAEARESGN